MFESVLKSVEETKPLVHVMTNYVTVNDCANIALACGGSPIMADDLEEVEEIVSICNGLVINIGTLNQRTIESMIKAGKKANELNKPVILDPVGAGASILRTETTMRLLKEVDFTVIRGNISEIKTLALGAGSTKGVDADINDRVTQDNIEEVGRFIKELSKKTKAVIAITGEIDLIGDEEKIYVIRNGHSMMAKITGTGCMLTTLIGCFVAADKENVLEATAAAIGVMGLSGEKAYRKTMDKQEGTGSFRVYLIDAVSLMNEDCLKEEIQIEVR